MKRTMAVRMVVAGLLVMNVALFAAEPAKAKKGAPRKADITQQAPVYRCPMHPDVTSDKPGKCPTCGMNLEKAPAPATKNGRTDGCTMQPNDKARANKSSCCDTMKGATSGTKEGCVAPAEQNAPQAPAASYTCPMHPDVTSDKPGRCPTCGMNLEKK
jgi:hypothetical protein